MNPYQELDDSAFWRPSVADRNMFDIESLWNPKFNIKASDPVATYGSCFAQHIGRALKDRGFHWLISEPAPEGLEPKERTNFNYDVFSSRTGNTYTTSLLKQWVEWALERTPVPGEFWEQKGRYLTLSDRTWNPRALPRWTRCTAPGSRSSRVLNHP